MFGDTKTAAAHLGTAREELTQILERNLGRLDDRRSLFEDDEEGIRFAIGRISHAMEILRS